MGPETCWTSSLWRLPDIVVATRFRAFLSARPGTPRTRGRLPLGPRDEAGMHDKKRSGPAGGTALRWAAARDSRRASALDARKRNAFHEVTLERDEDDDHRDGRDEGARKERPPVHRHC